MFEERSFVNRMPGVPDWTDHLGSPATAGLVSRANSSEVWDDVAKDLKEAFDA